CSSWSSSACLGRKSCCSEGLRKHPDGVPAGLAFDLTRDRRDETRLTTAAGERIYQAADAPFVAGARHPSHLAREPSENPRRFASTPFAPARSQGRSSR